MIRAFLILCGVLIVGTGQAGAQIGVPTYSPCLTLGTTVVCGGGVATIISGVSLVAPNIGAATGTSAELTGSLSAGGALNASYRIYGKGIGTTSATYAARFENSAGSFLGGFRDDGLVNIANNFQVAGLTIAQGQMQIGTNTALTLSPGEMGWAKIAASGTAPGASAAKTAWVCGTNAGSAKMIAYAGTSTTPVTIVDNVGSGVTGC